MAVLVKGLMVGGHHRAQENDVQRSGAQLAADTLWVAWLRGTFGRDAQPSSADFLHHMDWLKHVYSKVGPSGVPPLVHRALSRECSRAPVGHCLAGWGMAPKTLS